MTIPPGGARFAGATAAVAGATPRALERACSLALALRMRPVQVSDSDRAAYHAAAAMASNFLTTLTDAAERLAATTGVDRERLLPIVRATIDNWLEDGGPDSLTGPIARGDEATVARHRAAVSERCPEDLDLFDALAAATRRLAARQHSEGSGR
jgi:predicted short-subunit dehydrogenase-like oxidoreductase (DUF2520 family)